MPTVGGGGLFFCCFFFVLKKTNHKRKKPLSLAAGFWVCWFGGKSQKKKTRAVGGGANISEETGYEGGRGRQLIKARGPKRGNHEGSTIPKGGGNAQTPPP